MRHLCRSFLLLCWLMPGVSFAHSGQVEQVRQFVVAFNSHDSAQMAQYVTADVQWLSVNGDVIAVQTSGKAALTEAMDGYFESCPSCRSELLEISEAGTHVSTIEQASWLQNDVRRTQKSLAVYQFSGDLIQRVYYFPAD